MTGWPGCLPYSREQGTQPWELGAEGQAWTNLEQDHKHLLEVARGVTNDVRLQVSLVGYRKKHSSNLNSQGLGDPGQRLCAAFKVIRQLSQVPKSKAPRAQLLVLGCESSPVPYHPPAALDSR